MKNIETYANCFISFNGFLPIMLNLISTSTNLNGRPNVAFCLERPFTFRLDSN